jgi:SAM-dependent methyltransferase
MYNRILRMLAYDISHFDIRTAKIYLRLIEKSTYSMINRTPNLSSEEFFWSHFFNQTFKKRGYILEKKPNDYGLPLIDEALKNAVEELKRKFESELCLLDVGSGPLSKLYTSGISGEKDVRAVCIDPLAPLFNNLHRQYATGYDMECIRGFGEQLNSYFKEETFHLVYTRNSLDHSTDPLLFVKNLYKITKKEGYIILAGHIKTGTNEHWIGLHKWDIEAEDDKLLLTNQNKTIRKQNLFENLNVSLVHKSLAPTNNIPSYLFKYVKN